MSDLNRWKTLFIVSLVAAVPAFIVLVVLLVQQHPMPASKAAVISAGLVQINADGFLPATITVKVGTPVTWTNRDNQGIGHWVEADPFPNPANPADLTSGGLRNQMQYTYTFSHPGTYHYHDRADPTHTGTVVVQGK